MTLKGSEGEEEGKSTFSGVLIWGQALVEALSALLWGQMPLLSPFLHGRNRDDIICLRVRVTHRRHACPALRGLLPHELLCSKTGQVLTTQDG